ncbi:MAG: hypothetical protein JW729_08955, partial [Bacteroidales bacterium]|nr:hypothetical protein [Bacteroidales bacterium]
TKLFNLTIALLITGSAFSQVPDTLVVYEYLLVTDTVWVEPYVEKIAAKHETCSEQNAFEPKTQLEFSSFGKSEQPFSYNRQLNDDETLLSNNTKSHFFSKPLVGVYLGYTRFWLKPNQYGAFAMTGANHAGIELKFPFYNNRWAVSAGIHSRGKPLSMVSSIMSYSGEFTDTLDTRVEAYYSFPLLLHYQRERWRIFGGCEFKNAILMKDDDLLLPEYKWIEMGLTLGIECLIRPQLAVTGKIYANNFWRTSNRLNSNLYSGITNSISLKFYLIRNRKS